MGALCDGSLFFGWEEYVSFFSFLLVSVVIGVYFGWIRGDRNTIANHTLVNKSMKVFPIAVSLIFSHISGITLIGYPSEVYEYGTHFVFSFVALVVVVYVTNEYYLPVFYSLQVTSIYEYLELRFSVSLRKICSILFSLSMIFYIPIIIYLPASAFNQVTGISIHYITFILCAVCIFYTTTGGLRAIVWTDTIQGLFTAVSLLAIIILGIHNVGGLQQVYKASLQGGRFEFINFSLNPFTRCSFISLNLGLMISWISLLTVHPASTRRIIALPTVDAAKKSMIWFSIGTVILIALSNCLGLIMYAQYAGCDPLASKRVTRVAQIFPHFIRKIGVIIPGMAGLFLSGIASAALSCMSAGINTMSLTIYEDFLRGVMPKESTEATVNYVVKICTAVFGIICVMMVFIVERMNEGVQVSLSLLGTSNSALMAVITLGLFFPSVNTKGAIASVIGSTLINTLIIVGGQLSVQNGYLIYSPHKSLDVSKCPYNVTATEVSLTNFREVAEGTYLHESIPIVFALSFTLYPVCGILIGIAVGIAVSFMTGGNNVAALNQVLITPIARKFLPKINKYSIARRIKFKAKPSTDKIKLIRTFKSNTEQLNTEPVKN